MLKPEMVLVLVDIRSAHNVGSIFRTADAAGVVKIYLAGYTPAPLDRFGRPVKEITKTALGAEQSVAWARVEAADKLISQLKESGDKKFRVIALEQSADAVDYRRVKMAGPTALVLGNEVAGLPPALLQLCDAVAEIPMRGRKESLNVAVAAGIALFRLLDH